MGKRKVTSFAPGHEHDLTVVAPKPPRAYADDSLAALTVYSLYWLHQWGLRRTIEAVTVLNWRLFPEKFAMLGFSEFPDAFRTNRSLLQGQPKYRNWLTGTATKGFSLNARGMDLARELAQRLGVPENGEGKSLGELPSAARSVPIGRARTVEQERETQRVRAHRLFDRWKRGEMNEVDLIHVHSLLGIFDHTPAKVRQKKMGDLERAAADVGDAEVQQFLNAIRQQFPLVLA